jgi:hypothetical protein
MPSQSRDPIMHPLIASDRIEGTLVCRDNGTQLGTIERLMINKISGQVAYAVVKNVETSGVRKIRFPLRWDGLHDDRRRGAYVVDLSEDEIRRVPPVTAGSIGVMATTWRTFGPTARPRSGARRPEFRPGSLDIARRAAWRNAAPQQSCYIENID